MTPKSDRADAHLLRINLKGDAETEEWLKKPNSLPRVGLLSVLQHFHHGIRAGIEHHGSALPRS